VGRRRRGERSTPKRTGWPRDLAAWEDRSAGVSMAGYRSATGGAKVTRTLEATVGRWLPHSPEVGVVDKAKAPQAPVRSRTLEPHEAYRKDVSKNTSRPSPPEVLIVTRLPARRDQTRERTGRDGLAPPGRSSRGPRVAVAGRGAALSV
jgi:hypothetical protein